MRPEYALAVAVVVSATIVGFARVESRRTSLRAPGSCTSTRLPGSARTFSTAVHGTVLLATTGPSCRMGGCCCAPSAVAILRAAARNERGRIISVCSWPGDDHRPYTVAADRGPRTTHHRGGAARQHRCSGEARRPRPNRREVARLEIARDVGGQLPLLLGCQQLLDMRHQP